MWKFLPQRLRTEARDLIELVLAPGLASVLPWPWCFAIFKRLARVRWLYGAACAQALEQAQARGQVAEGDAALDVIREMSKVEGAVVGAGQPGRLHPLAGRCGGCRHQY